VYFAATRPYRTAPTRLRKWQRPYGRAASNSSVSPTTRDPSITRGGLSHEEIEQQWREADQLNSCYGSSFRILRGIESDILSDGSLHYPDRILRDFDFVVASVHSYFRLSKQDQTERMIKAIRNWNTSILGHMTGRQLQRRPGYELDINKVLEICAKCGVAVEINAKPLSDVAAFSVSIRMPARFGSSILCIGASRWLEREEFRLTGLSIRCPLRSCRAFSETRGADGPPVGE
jgi:hypothetical protein